MGIDQGSEVERVHAFVIGSRHGDFLLGVKFFGRDGSHLAGYCRDPGSAQWFSSEKEARRVIADMGRAGQLEVLPLIDVGEKWKVWWPKDWDIGEPPSC